MSKAEIKKLVSQRVSTELAGHQLFEQVDTLIGTAHRHLAEAEDVLHLIVDMTDDDHPSKQRLTKRLALLSRYRELLDDLYNLLSGDFDNDMQERLYSILYTTEFARTIETLRRQTSTGRFRSDAPNEASPGKPAVPEG